MKRKTLSILFIWALLLILTLPVYAETGEMYFSSQVALSATERSQTYADIRLNKTKVSIYVTESITLRVTGVGIKKIPVWKSSNPTVATVSSKGKIYGKRAGIATITATVNGVTKSCKVTVKGNWYKKVLDKQTGSYLVENRTTNQKCTVYRQHFKYYCVIDINHDGVKELLLYTNPEMVLFTYYKGKVTPLLYSNFNRSLRLKNNYFTILTGTSSENTGYIYTLNGNKMKKVITFFHTTSTAYPVPIYRLDGKNCSKTAFDRAYNKYYVNGQYVLDLCRKI